MDIAEFTEAAKEDPRLQLGVATCLCGTQKVVTFQALLLLLRKSCAGHELQKTE